MSLPDYFNALLIGEDSTVKGSETIGGNLTVEGNKTIDGNLALLGNLSVGGVFTGATLGNSFEVVSAHMTGANTQFTFTVTLLNNTGATTLYSIFPSMYYGFSGTSGTYNALASSGASLQMVITQKTTTNFVVELEATNGENFNVYIVFLVVYAYPANYPTNY